MWNASKMSNADTTPPGGAPAAPVIIPEPTPPLAPTAGGVSAPPTDADSSKPLLPSAISFVDVVIRYRFTTGRRLVSLQLDQMKLLQQLHSTKTKENDASEVDIDSLRFSTEGHVTFKLTTGRGDDEEEGEFEEAPTSPRPSRGLIQGTGTTPAAVDGTALGAPPGATGNAAPAPSTARGRSTATGGGSWGWHYKGKSRLSNCVLKRPHLRQHRETVVNCLYTAETLQ